MSDADKERILSFQSALRAEARSDSKSAGELISSGEFQSALRAEARSDQRAPAAILSVDLFQSALRAEARSDQTGQLYFRAHLCFNPRSAPKRGATAALRGNPSMLICFNPRSAPKRGATPSAILYPAIAVVSIRAPRRSAERPGAAAYLRQGMTLCFNPRSAPKRGATAALPKGRTAGNYMP